MARILCDLQIVMNAINIAVYGLTLVLRAAFFLGAGLTYGFHRVIFRNFTDTI